jgi:hypothetical protein
MDEYLFITMAKLKADRLRLQREQAERSAEVRDRAEESRETKRSAHWPFAESGHRRWTLTSR